MLPEQKQAYNHHYAITSEYSGEIVIAGETTTRYNAIMEACKFILAVLPPQFHVLVARTKVGMDVYRVLHKKKGDEYRLLYSITID